VTQPFKCPQCGFNDYLIVLTDCNIQGATVHQNYMWDEEANDYIFGGTMVVETESVETGAGKVTCMGCEADVTEAVRIYEQSQPDPGGGEVQP
jgi:hypothetical protein